MRSTKGLSDDELEAIIDRTGFDENQPLIDFENYFRFSSLRNMIEDQITKWLKTDNPAPNFRP